MYNYQAEKQKIFTEEGQVMFLQVRDTVQKLLNLSGAVMVSHIINNICGDTWLMLACIDRLVELNEICEITTGNIFSAQSRVFVKK